MINLNKNDIQAVSGGMSQQIPVEIQPDVEDVIVSRPPPPYEDDGYPWIQPPYGPEKK